MSTIQENLHSFVQQQKREKKHPYLYLFFGVSVVQKPEALNLHQLADNLTYHTTTTTDVPTIPASCGSVCRIVDVEYPSKPGSFLLRHSSLAEVKSEALLFYTYFFTDVQTAAPLDSASVLSLLEGLHLMEHATSSLFKEHLIQTENLEHLARAENYNVHFEEGALATIATPWIEEAA